MNARNNEAILALILITIVSASSCGLIDELLGTDLAGDGTPTPITGLEKAGTVSYSTAARDVVGEGSYAYVATYTYSGTAGGLSIVNVSNPASPVKHGTYYPSLSDYRLYAGYITKSGDNVYIDGGNVRMFAKVNVANPASPYLVYQKNGSDLSMGLIADGATLYYNSYPNESLHIFDVSDTVAPIMSEVSYKPANGAPGAGCAADGYLYLRTNNDTIKILKLNAAGAGLDEIGSLPIGGLGTGGIVKEGDYLYQQYIVESTWTGMLQIIDVSNPAAPVIKSSIPAQRTKKIAVSQSCVFIVTPGNIDLYDVGNPEEPVLIATLPDAGMDPSGVSTAGDVLLVADGGGGSGKLRCYRMLK